MTSVEGCKHAIDFSVPVEEVESETARKDAEAISSFLADVFQRPDPRRDGRGYAGDFLHCRVVVVDLGVDIGLALVDQVVLDVLVVDLGRSSIVGLLRLVVERLFFERRFPEVVVGRAITWLGHCLSSLLGSRVVRGASRRVVRC